MFETYIAFDPGFTTGFALARYDVDTNALTVLDMRPLMLNEGMGKRIRMEHPPIECFEHWYNEVDSILRTETVTGYPVHVAIEDFVGGKGGDVQNTVNKLIGILMAISFNLDSAGVTPPKVFRNNSRLKYLPRVQEATSGLPGISHHSKDALAHLLHRVYQQHSDKFDTMRIWFNLKSIPRIDDVDVSIAVTELTQQGQRNGEYNDIPF